MPITLSLSSVDLDDEALQELTRQLCRDLGDEAGIAATPATESAGVGKKGDFEIIGQILIKAAGAGGQSPLWSACSKPMFSGSRLCNLSFKRRAAKS
ncbi:MAG TPA: hypothetical protein VFV58_07775 [Blastocatellia bacterium]|jgi:hypothetical protein|nr:hypothetical protein [Blastocatellia bacterium]